MAEVAITSISIEGLQKATNALININTSYRYFTAGAFFRSDKYSNEFHADSNKIEFNCLLKKTNEMYINKKIELTNYKKTLNQYQIELDKYNIDKKLKCNDKLSELYEYVINIAEEKIDKVKENINICEKFLKNFDESIRINQKINGHQCFYNIPIKEYYYEIEDDIFVEFLRNNTYLISVKITSSDNDKLNKFVDTLNPEKDKIYINIYNDSNTELFHKIAYHLEKNNKNSNLLILAKYNNIHSIYMLSTDYMKYDEHISASIIINDNTHIIKLMTNINNYENLQKIIK